jgi:hypothetical protein
LKGRVERPGFFLFGVRPHEDRRLLYVGVTRVKADLPNRIFHLAPTYAQTMSAVAAFKRQAAMAQLNPEKSQERARRAERRKYVLYSCAKIGLTPNITRGRG